MNDINHNLDRPEAIENHFAFYDLITDLVKFWKTILVVTFIFTLLPVFIYFQMNENYKNTIYVSKINDVENLLKDTLNNVALINYEQDFKRPNNLVPITSIAGRLYDSYNASEFLSAFIENFKTGRSVYATSSKYIESFGSNSYDFISQNLSIKENNNSVTISFKSENMELGKKVLKDLINDNLEILNNDIKQTLKLRIENLKKLFEIDNEFYRKLIETEIRLIDENIVLAEHLDIEAPASEQLNSRVEQLIGLDLGNIDFKMPLYLYGYKALRVAKDIMIKRLDQKEQAPYIQSSIEQTKYILEVLENKKITYVKYNENVIETISDKLPLVFFILAGLLVGIPLAILTAFFRLASLRRSKVS